MAFAARSRLFCEREGSALRDLRLVVGIKIAERPPMTQEKPSEGVGGNACASRAWKGNGCRTGFHPFFFSKTPQLSAFWLRCEGAWRLAL